MAQNQRRPLHANPNDTTYRLKDQEREKYAPMGESYRFILKFVKPVETK